MVYIFHVINLLQMKCVVLTALTNLQNGAYTMYSDVLSDIVHCKFVNISYK